MPYNATVKFVYDNDSPQETSKYFPEIVDQHTIKIEAPCQDMNVHQYFALFKSFLRAIDFREYNIMDGACQLAFNDMNDESEMKKLMDEYELQDKQAYTDDDARALEDEIRKLKEEIASLKEKLLSFSENIKVTTNDPFMAWKGLVPGSPEAQDSGCLCPVLDNQEMPEDRKWVNADCPIHGRSK